MIEKIPDLNRYNTLDFVIKKLNEVIDELNKNQKRGNQYERDNNKNNSKR